MESKYTPQNILITGGCGFIASHIVNTFVEKYPMYNIVNIDKMDECSSMKNCSVSGNPNYKFVKGDIASADLVRYILENEKIDTIIHAAAQSHVDNSFGNSLSFTQNNVIGTHVLLETAKAVGIKRFIHVSTDEVYGSCDSVERTEDSVLDPSNPYAASKAAAEHIVKGYMNSFQFPAIITRGNNVYGPGQYPEKLVPKCIMRLKAGLPCCIHGDGSNRRHFIHVSDVVSAFDVIMHKGVTGSTYNIGSHDEFPNLFVATEIIKMLKMPGNAEDHIELVNDRAFNDVRYLLSYSKLTALGWAPKVSFHEGLKETIEWYGQHANQHWGDISHAILPHPINVKFC